MSGAHLTPDEQLLHGLTYKPRFLGYGEMICALVRGAKPDAETRARIEAWLKEGESTGAKGCWLRDLLADVS